MDASLVTFLLTGKGFARCGTTNDKLRAWKKSSTCENLPGAAFNPASCETHVVRRAFFSYNFSFFVSIKLIIFSFRMENLRLNPKKFSENVLRNFFANFMHTFEIFTHFDVILSRCGSYGVFPKMAFRRNF